MFFFFLSKCTPKNFYPSFLTTLLGCLHSDGRQHLCDPKGEVASYGWVLQTTYICWGEKILFLLVLSTPALALSLVLTLQLVKLFTEPMSLLYWQKINCFFWDNLPLDYWVVSILSCSQQAPELVEDKQDSMSKSDMGSVGLPLFNRGSKMLGGFRCPVLLLHWDSHSSLKPS